jgi:hypothetical protein
MGRPNKILDIINVKRYIGHIDTIDTGAGKAMA